MKDRRLRSLKLLEEVGLNVPLYAVITKDDPDKARYFKKQCAVRFDLLKCPLPPLPGEVIVVRGWPPLIAHSSPCVAAKLSEVLDCDFVAHVTDVTSKDSVGAGVTLKTAEGKVIVEAVVKGTVRDVTRKGLVHVRGEMVGEKLVAKGPFPELLGYCMFESAREALRLPPGALEWSCHEGKYGVKGDHVVFWELITLKG